MKNQSLFLKYSLAGDTRIHVKRAVRIVADGKGGLWIHTSATARPERIDLSTLSSFSIHNVRTTADPAPAYAA